MGTILDTTLTTRLIAIGNSRGLRIPKTVLEQLQLDLKDEVTLEIKNGALIVRPASHPRAGWEAAALELTTRGEDAMLDPETPTAWETDWQW